MNGDAAALAEVEALMAAHPAPGVDIVICPPATLIDRMARRLGPGPIAIGGQTCHAAAHGAHTGDISASMLLDAGASHVILGHSERRADHHETDSLIRAQAQAAQAVGLRVILCLGETAEERAAGTALRIVARQLDGSLPETADPLGLILAYEPIWAIGTGEVPTQDQIAEMHASLRAALVARFGGAGRDIPILYGGSVKPANATAIFGIANVDGALVGGASLKAAEFSAIIAALETA